MVAQARASAAARMGWARWRCVYDGITISTLRSARSTNARLRRFRLSRSDLEASFVSQRVKSRAT
jgi:hypothetical protein